MKKLILCVLSFASVAAYAAPEVWVAENGDDTTGTGTAEKPYATIATGVAKCDDNGTVHVADGDYPISEEIVVARGVRVIGAGAECTIVHRLSTAKPTKAADAQTGDLLRIFRINHQDSRVDGFTIANGYTIQSQGSGVYIDTNGGTLASSIIENCTVYSANYTVCAPNNKCVVTNCTIRNNSVLGYNGNSPGVYCGGALITDTYVINNVRENSETGTYLGIYMNGGTVRRCVIMDNESKSTTAPSGAGGIFVDGNGGTIEGCLIANNGGQYLHYAGVYANCRSYGLTIKDTTIADNYSDYCAGLYVPSTASKKVTVVNCIIQGARSEFAGPDCGAEWECCGTGGISFDNCVSPVGFPEGAGDGNVKGTVDFVDAENGDYRLAFSPCGLTCGWKPFDATTAEANFGFRASEPRTAVGKAVSFSAYGFDPEHGDLSYAWSFGDGEAGTGDEVSHTWVEAGSHTVTMTVSSGGYELASREQVIAVAADHDTYVVNAELNPNHVPEFPYDSWDKAATDIQSAIEAAGAGHTVWVSNGVYGITEQISVTNDVTVKSVCGRAATEIRRVNLDKNSKKIIQRVAYVNNRKARVDGFTLACGRNRYETDVAGYYPASGSGLLIARSGGVVSDCSITNDCVAFAQFVPGCGVGIYGVDAVLTNCLVTGWYLNGTRCRGAGLSMTDGLVTHCVISNNSIDSGYTLEGNVRIAGAGRITHSVIAANRSTGSVAGIVINDKGALVDNCLIAGNTSSGVGSGIYQSDNPGRVINCTIVGNTGTQGVGYYHNGNANGYLVNSIVTENIGSGSADTVQIYRPDNKSTKLIVSNSLCSTVFPAGGTYVDCLPTNAADFATGGYTLKPSSPARNKGWNGAYPNLAADTDLGGDERLVEDIVDIGCYEFQRQPAEAHFELDLNRVAEGYSVKGTASGYDPDDPESVIEFKWSVDGVAVTDWTTDAERTFAIAGIGDHVISLLAKIGGAEVDGGTKTVKVLSPVVYVVNPELNPGHEGVFPYSSWDTAATDIATAIDSTAGGGVVHVGPGVYVTEDELRLVEDVRLIGEEGAAATEIRRKVTSRPGSGTLIARVINIESAGASVEGLTISGGYIVDNPELEGALYGNCGAGVRISSAGGNVIGCVITNCTANAYAEGGGIAMIGAGLVSNCTFLANEICGWTGAGGGIYMRDGLLTHCRFSANVSNTGNAGSSSSSAVYAFGGRVSHCSITNNIGRNTGGYAGGGGAFYAGLGVCVDNCLVAGNTSPNAAAGVYAYGAVLVNCTIVDNVSRLAGAGVLVRFDTVSKETSLFRNCLIQGNRLADDGTPSEFAVDNGSSDSGLKPVFEYSMSTVELPGAENVLGVAEFKGSRHAFRLRWGAKGWNAGSTDGYEDILSGTDLDGLPRILNGRVDIGAFETPQTGLTILLR